MNGSNTLGGVVDRLDAYSARLLLPLTVGGLLLGLAFSFAGDEAAATLCWTIPPLLVGTWLAISIVRDLLKGQAGVDLIAVLAIVGALLLGEALAAAVIGVMLATGEWLELVRRGGDRAGGETSQPGPVPTRAVAMSHPHGPRVARPGRRATGPRDPHRPALDIDLEALRRWVVQAKIDRGQRARTTSEA
jgi:hypothetical protein